MTKVKYVPCNAMPSSICNGRFGPRLSKLAELEYQQVGPADAGEPVVARLKRGFEVHQALP